MNEDEEDLDGAPMDVDGIPIEEDLDGIPLSKDEGMFGIINTTIFVIIKKERYFHSVNIN